MRHIPSFRLSYFDEKFSSLPLNRRGRASGTTKYILTKTVHVGANDVNSLLTELVQNNYY